MVSWQIPELNPHIRKIKFGICNEIWKLFSTEIDYVYSFKQDIWKKYVCC